MSYLYRGVHANHPQIAAARMGVVIPGKIDGRLSAEDHNLDGFQAISPYTSWTHHRPIAEFHRDLKGPGGVLLRVESGAPSPEDTWSWERSPDSYFEEEYLLHGVRIGVEVVL